MSNSVRVTSARRPVIRVSHFGLWPTWELLYWFDLLYSLCIVMWLLLCSFPERRTFSFGHIPPNSYPPGQFPSSGKTPAVNAKIWKLALANPTDLMLSILYTWSLCVVDNGVLILMSSFSFLFWTVLCRTCLYFNYGLLPGINMDGWMKCPTPYN